MKSSLLVSFLALTVSIVGFVLLLTNEPTSSARVVEPVLPIASGTDGQLAARVAELAEENRALKERLTNLELAPAAVQRTPLGGDFVGREEFDAFRDQVYEALGESRRVTKAPGKPLAGSELIDFREHVAVALTDIRKQEAAKKFRSIDERTEELDETMPKIDEWLGLSRPQSEKMRSALIRQYEREADLVRRWQEGEDDEVLGAMKRNDREVHYGELAEVLAPDQLATYAARTGLGK